MPRTVLDASAVLAVIPEEPGADVVVEALRSGAAMSTVNVGEVAARLHQDGWSESEVALVFDSPGIELLPFDPETALLSGRLRTATRRLGLGGRACLATGSIEGGAVLTSDRRWRQLDIAGVDIRCIRQAGIRGRRKRTPNPPRHEGARTPSLWSERDRNPANVPESARVEGR